MKDAVINTRHITGVFIKNNSGNVRDWWQNKITQKLQAYSELTGLENIDALDKALDVALSLHRQGDLIIRRLEKLGISYSTIQEIRNAIQKNYKESNENTLSTFNNN